MLKKRNFRREKQEKERAAKQARLEAAGKAGNHSKTGSKPSNKSLKSPSSAKEVMDEVASPVPKVPSKSKPNARVQKQVELFSHLRAYDNPSKITQKNVWENRNKIPHFNH